MSEPSDVNIQRFFPILWLKYCVLNLPLVILEKWENMILVQQEFCNNDNCIFLTRM